MLLAIKSRRIDEFHDWREERKASIGTGSGEPIVIETENSRIYSVTVIGVPPSQADRILVRARRLDRSAAVEGALATGERTPRRSLRQRLALLREVFS